MSTAEKPLAPALNMVAPAITSNNLDFYVFYSMNYGPTNYLAMTSMQSQTWATNNLTGQGGYLPNASPISANSTPMATAANGIVYVAYINTSNQIVVVSGAGASWTQSIIQYPFTNLQGFRIFNDGTYCYIGYNDDGMMKYTSYQNGNWTSPVLLNTGMGLCAQSPVALVSNQFTFYFDGNHIRCYYCASDQIASLRYRPGDQAGFYSSFMIISAGSIGYTLKAFNYVNSQSQSYPSLMIASQSGYVDVYISNNTQPGNRWNHFSLPSGSPELKYGADVSSVNGGVFVAYPDASGNIQMMFSMDGANFSTVQITGSGGYTNAPACNLVPTLATYNNFVLHMGYANTTPAITDVFWAFWWNTVNLYPLALKV
jgi:hypothetical protein